MNKTIEAEPISQTERRQAAAMHAVCGLCHVPPVPIPLGFVAILGMWLFGRSRSTFIDRLGRQTLNNYFTLCSVAAAMLLPILFVLGYFALFLAAAILVFGIVSGIRGALGAMRGELYRYPEAITPLS